MICNRVQGIFLLISEEVSSFMKRPLFLQCFKCLWCHKSQRKQWHPLQCPCLENPMDGGAWWAAVHGVWKVGHDWVTSHSLFTCMHWRKKWQPTPVLLPGESQGRRSPVAAVCGVAQSRTRLKRQQQQQRCHKSSVSVPGGYLKAGYLCPILLVYPCLRSICFRIWFHIYGSSRAPTFFSFKRALAILESFHSHVNFRSILSSSI